MGSIKLLKASAGSGKTYQLAYEYVRAVIAQPSDYRHILAVTFTNKATEEMKRRILQEINGLAQGKTTNYSVSLEAELSLSPAIIASRAATARAKILHDYSHFSILTIDKFFQRIIRSFIKELGVDLNFNLELQTESLLSTASDAIIDEISTNEELKKWIVAFVEEKIEDNKRWDVKTGLMKLGKEIFNDDYKRLSTQVTSKEELERIVSRVSTEALTVIKKMKTDASKALEVMLSYGLTISDFAYGNSSFASYFRKIAGGDIAPYGARVSGALESVETWYSKSSPLKDTIIAASSQLLPYLEEICHTYDKNEKLFNSVELLRENYRNFALLVDLSQKVDLICAAESIMPISQTNSILNKLIAGNDTPFIFEKVGNHFLRFMIDEFQDTSTMQWENFLPLLRNAVSQSEGSPVLLVGDIKQSIYRWRGGDWRILAQEIEREFSDVITMDLTTNYRSSKNVIAFNNSIISSCTTLDNDYLNNQLAEAQEQGYIGASLRTQLHDTLKNAYKNHEQLCASNQTKGYVNVTYYQRGELPPVISHIEQIQERGYLPGEIAILVRNNIDGIKVANMLLEHKNNNPHSKYSYDVVTQQALTIGNAPVVSFVIACMKMSTSAEESLVRAIYNNWLGFAVGAELSAQEREFIESIRLKSPIEAIEAILIRYKLSEVTENIAYLQALHEQIIAFSNSTVSDIPLFVKWWEANGARDSINVPPNREAITIITIHKAKGLEYKAVVIPYCNWSLPPHSKSIIWSKGANEGHISELGTMPIGYSEKIQNSAFAEDGYSELVMSHIDNINTFYVAITRAMEELHLMLPQSASKSKKDDAIKSINQLIDSSINSTSNIIALGSIDGVAGTVDGNRVVEFGEPSSVASADETAQTDVNIPYLSYEISDRLSLKLSSQRYFDDAQGVSTLSPRDYGVLMHLVFEGAKGVEDVEKSIQQMVTNGSVSQTEAEQLNKTIAKVFDNALVKSWFYDSWEQVRNEEEIIIPGNTPRRPDRVMIKGDRAVVVDYKFGLNRPSEHRKQLKLYMDVLVQMGYKYVEGYIWYVSMDDIETIQPQ